MTLHMNSNWGGLCGASFLVALVVLILAADRYEEQVVAAWCALVNWACNMHPWWKGKYRDYDYY
jgi:hypothetical protein